MIISATGLFKLTQAHLRFDKKTGLPETMKWIDNVCTF